MARVVLGVSGGIAAYKACELLRRLRESGHAVRVIPTANALKFVGSATWEALSGQPVANDVFHDVDQVAHVRLGQEADLVVVAPATANVLAKAAHGLADDLLTNVLLTARCPVMFAPAMHTEMWEHAATQANVDVLRSRGVLVVEPAVGRLTGVDIGKGRLPEPDALASLCEHLLVRGELTPDLTGRRVIVSAGGTREAIDPVRFIGNRSSGKQGFALALAAAARGATVDVVAANVEVSPPAGVTVHSVESTAEMSKAMHELAAGADVVVMAAAVADFRPTDVGPHKIKKSDPGAGEPSALQLEQTEDILVSLVKSSVENQIVVGFAAETGDHDQSWLDHGRAKLARKGCDFLVVNQVGDGLAFGTDENSAVILDARGGETEVAPGPKVALADVVWNLVGAALAPMHHR